MGQKEIKMKNYEYIIAGLPVIDSGFRFTDKTPDQFIEEIREQLDDRDNAIVDFLLRGYAEENLTPEFYKEALGHRNRFIREYFAFDLNLRNAKVRFLNKALNRPAGKDVMALEGKDGETVTLPFEEEARVVAALQGDDLLARERALDDIIWDKVSAMTVFDIFDIENILAFIVKMQVTARWYRLDEQTGREMFRKLVDEVRGTFKGVNYSPDGASAPQEA